MFGFKIFNFWSVGVNYRQLIFKLISREYKKGVHTLFFGTPYA